MFTILSQLRARFEYSQSASCLPTNGFSPHATAAVSSSFSVFPSSFSFITSKIPHKIYFPKNIGRGRLLRKKIPIFVLAGAVPENLTIKNFYSTTNDYG